MPFLAVPPAWIQAGLPTKEEIFQYLVDNQDSFNTDIEALKQTSQFDILDVSVAGSLSEYDSAEIQERMPVFKAFVSGTITSVVVSLLEDSTSGTLQIDLEKSIDNGANWSALFSSPVEVTGTTAGSISGAVNFINTAAQSFNQNELIRLVVTGTQTNQGQFHVSVYGELS